MKKLIPQKIKNIYHLCRSVFSAAWFGFPAKKMKVIGVTGTNGKTTTVQMISKILQESGKKVAVSSTINFQIDEKSWINKTKFTTLSGWQTQKFIKKAQKAGCEYLVLEVASHALDQNRVWGIDFDVVVITNVTREHLDYHKTMEQYRKAKALLFGKIKKDGVAVINLDMENPDEFAFWAGRAKKYGYSTKSNDLKEVKNELEIVQARNIEQGKEGSSFEIEGTKFSLKIAGNFNIENALAAICAALCQKISLQECSQALSKIEVISGRMDKVENEKGLDIFIDYAVTPDSMRKLGEYAKNKKGEGKIFWVFGSCGERDRGKRPIMGDVVAKYSDVAIVTNEDPYGEDPKRIIEEVFVGVLEGGKVENENAFKIFDRKDAIKKALSSAQEGDIVLITGKGAEETMAVGKKRIKWNDREVVLDLLKEI